MREFPVDQFNIYCDESCHLENDGQKSMGLGGVICPTRYASLINHELKRLKVEHNMPHGFELKWTKVGKAKMDYYRSVVDLFFRYAFLRFRGYIIPDKGVIDHSKIPGQTHDEWYYKMYFKMLKPIIESSYNEYRIYIDIKDTHGYEKTQRLKEILQHSIYDFDEMRVTRIQEVRSDEVELLQLADFILGAVVYTNRGTFSSPCKAEIVDAIRNRSGLDLLHSTPYRANKMNLWMWTGGQ